MRDRFAASGPASAPVTGALLAINVAFWLLLEFTGGSQNSENLYRWGAKFGPAIYNGDWWRLIVPVFMHIGLLHLAANSVGLLIFGSMVERIFGKVQYLAIYLITGVAGNVASYWAGPTLGAGGSGALFGVVGAFAIYLLLNRRLLGRYGRQAFTSVVFIVLINVVIGMTVTGIDNAAHIGGLVAGAATALLLAPRERVYVAMTDPVFGAPRLSLRTIQKPGFRVALAVLLASLILYLAVRWVSSDYLSRIDGL